MIPRNTLLLLISVVLIGAGTPGFAEEKKAYSGTGCAANVDDYFINEVWSKVASQACLKCHKPGGDADDEGSKFICRDPERCIGEERAKAHQHNQNLFAKMAREKD